MKKKFDVREVAGLHNLLVIETTTGMNGYPQDCKFALRGFDTFDEAEKLANE